MSISTRTDNNFEGKNAPITRQDPIKVEVVIVSRNFRLFDQYLPGGLYYDYRYLCTISSK